MIELSVVVPVFNEQDNMQPMITAVHESLANHIDYELLIVDDGSTDETVLRAQPHLRPQDKCIELNRNYGQSAAMAAGIEYAQGKLVVTLDGDLQNRPEDILSMIELMNEKQCDVVAGWRQNRQDGMLFRKIPSMTANFLIRWLTGVVLRDYGCTLKLFKRDVAKNLGLYGELHRFIPVLAKLYGANIEEMPVRHHARIHGVSKYGISRTVRVWCDLMLMVFFQKYGTRPMHLFGTIGVGLLFLGMAMTGYLGFLKLLGYSVFGRPLLVIGAFSMISGIQLITTGFLSEVMMRTYYESQGKKPYHIKPQMLHNESTVRLSSAHHAKSVSPSTSAQQT
jgi:glycosyltransferase involved in cell wall biosynthesis